ncbi:MAG: hypothetical protein K2Z80_14960 [Xanthobacteraceae bacterium]|nr:hypothetical protein [Xanthobacteraceae bacterium]
MEFSENLDRLLRNSLTVERPDFTRKIAAACAAGQACPAHFNQTFTMTGRRNVPALWTRHPRLAFA